MSTGNPFRLIGVALGISMMLLSQDVSVYGKERGIRVLTRDLQGTTKQIRLYSGYHALVVGCGAYRNGWPALPNPVRDAREVKDTLEKLGWSVDLLEDPDWGSLRRGLNELITGPGRDKESAILFWFSGHGHTLAEAGDMKLGYIVPVDAPDPDRNELGFMEKSISMRQIETVARRIQSRHVLMVFDSCFSGAVFQAVRAKPSPYIKEKIAKPVRQFITAGTEDEQVPDKSVFKEVFLQGIRDAYADRNEDSYVTGLEIGDYLQEQVVNYSRGGQHPQFGKINDPKLDKGDFVFVARGSVVVDKPGESDKRTGALIVDTQPVGAVVWVDGVRKGASPQTVGDLEPGLLRVRASLQGYEDQEEKVRILAGRETRITLILDRTASRGNLAVKSEPTGARWYLDGAYVGTTPDKVDCEAETHRVEVKKEGYEDWSETVQVATKGRVPVKTKLERSEPLAGEIWREPVTGMEFVWVPGGCYEMGSPLGESGRAGIEGPVHEVCVEGFWLGRHEVTNGQYRMYYASHDSGGYKGRDLNGRDQPVWTL